MLFFLFSYLGGALTLFAPCILPVVPFVFARADQPFARSGLPLLAGMALTFAAVGSLGAVAGQWAAQANDYGRLGAIGVLALMGLSLLAPRWAERLGRPLATLGSRMSNAATNGTRTSRNPAWTSLLLGSATGLLWAPCAGPILGLILTGAAIEGPSARTSLLLLAYAAGAASSLALLLLAGGRALAAARRVAGLGEWVRKGLGVAVLAGVATVAFGLDSRWLTQLSPEGGAAIEKTLLQRLGPRTPTAGGLMPVQDRMGVARLDLPVEGTLPPIVGAVDWLNSAPLTAEGLRGKVVLVDFWTFGCINCRNALPHVREWHRKYKYQGLVVLSVHTPEFAYEKNIGNVKKAVSDLGVEFPVAIDNDFAIWRAFHNNYWPALYFVDAAGRIRFHHFGEGEYDKSEQVIRQLLEEANKGRQPV